MNLNMDLTRIKNRKIRNECEINLIVLMKGYKVLWLVDQLHGKQLDILKQEETFPIKRKYLFFLHNFQNFCFRNGEKYNFENLQKNLVDNY